MCFVRTALLLYVFASFVSGQPNQATGTEQDSAQKNTPLSESVPTFQDRNNPNQRTENHPTSTEADSFNWDTAIKRPEWWLVLGAFLTLPILIWQAVVSRRAIEESRNSIRLQEKAFSQWVDLANWKTELRPHSTTPEIVHVSVELLNQTAFPVTLNDAQISFAGHKYSIGQDCFLPPKLPHVIAVQIRLTQEEVSRFAIGMYSIRISGHITYTGVLGKPATHQLGGLLQFSQSSAAFESEVPMTPQTKTATNQG
jgi:hypothetical protein